LLANQELTGGIGAGSTSGADDTNIRLQFRISEQAFEDKSIGVTLDRSELFDTTVPTPTFTQKAKDYFSQKLFTINKGTLQSFNTQNFIEISNTVRFPTAGGGSPPGPSPPGPGGGVIIKSSDLGIEELVQGGTLLNQIKATDWTNPQSSQLFAPDSVKYTKRISKDDGTPDPDYAPYFIQTLYGASYSQYTDEDGITHTVFFSGGYMSLFDLKQFIIAGSLRGITSSMDPSSYQVGRWELGATGESNAWFLYGDSYNKRNKGSYNLILGSGFQQDNPTINANNPSLNTIIGYENLGNYNKATYNTIVGGGNLELGYDVETVSILGNENIYGTTKANNVVLIGNGTTGSSQITNSIYIGNYNKGQGTTNEIIIGNYLTGKGNNTSIIGGNLFIPDGITGTTLTNATIINPKFPSGITATTLTRPIIVGPVGISEFNNNSFIKFQSFEKPIYSYGVYGSSFANEILFEYAASRGVIADLNIICQVALAHVDLKGTVYYSTAPLSILNTNLKINPIYGDAESMTPIDYEIVRWGELQTGDQYLNLGLTWNNSAVKILGTITQDVLTRIHITGKLHPIWYEWEES